MSRPSVPGLQHGSIEEPSRGPPLNVAGKPNVPQHMHPQQFSRGNAYDGSANGPAAQSVSLPPMRQLSNTPPTPSTDRRQGNPLHSILNPQQELAIQAKNRSRSASQMQSPSPVEPQGSQTLPSLSRPTSVDPARDDSLSSRPFQHPARPPFRPMGGSRSPALHRTHSLNVLSAPTGTIDAHQTPFLTASSRPFEHPHNTSQPTLPTPPVGHRAGYFPNTGSTAPTPPPGMVRNDMQRPSISFPQSGSASPNASYSPYSQPASIASSQYEVSSQQGAFLTMHNQEHSSLPLDAERGIPMGSSGQTIQMMTIKSQQGHHVQIPVDVQAASKVADEKRKRNAGASARFRARRKEKEREASQSISRLEQQLRNAFEDVEYYRGERDYFKSILIQQPGAERHYAARPPSPRLRRLSAAPSNAASSNGGGGSGSSYSGFEEQENVLDDDRNVRRRTSSYHPASGPPPAGIPNTSGPPTPSYPQSSFAPTISQPPSSQSYDGRGPRPLQELQHPSSQRPVLRDPFSSDAARYDGRGWLPPANRDERR